MTIVVADVVNNGISLAADFPSLSGDPGTAFTYNLKVTNDTKAVQTLVIADRPGLRIDAGQTTTRQVAALEPGDHRVTLEGAPFQATLRAEE